MEVVVCDQHCSIELKREEFLYIRTIFNFQAVCVLIYMLLFHQISAWVFLIHMFLYAGFYCTTIREAFRKDLRSVGVDPSTFGFYSLCSRGATSAAYNGVSDSVFQWLGHWKSELSFVISPNTLSLYVLCRVGSRQAVPK